MKRIEPAADRLRASLTFVILLCLSASVAASAEVLDLDGRKVNPFRLPADAYVFFFVQASCPISNRYAPEMRRLFQMYGQGPTRFFLVYVNSGETSEAIGRHLEEFGLNLPVLLDPEHRIVRRAGAKVTPESSVFSSAGELLYRGRIDNRYFELGRARPAATRFDLEEALRSLQGGEKPEFRETEAFGCFISDLQ